MRSVGARLPGPHLPWAASPVFLHGQRGALYGVNLAVHAQPTAAPPGEIITGAPAVYVVIASLFHGAAAVAGRPSPGRGSSRCAS
jgi:hypothetical protein